MLTDQLLNTLVALDKPIKKSDGGVLHIFITPFGRKRWRLAYRFEGKRRPSTAVNIPLSASTVLGSGARR